MSEAYVDEDYYMDEYEGSSVNTEDFSRFAKRASELIDILTDYQIPKIGLDKFSDLVQELVKKACCAQIEYYQLEGINVNVNGAPRTSQSVSIGDYSQSGSSGSTNNQASRVSPACLTFLDGTGLLRKRSVRIGVI